MKRVFLDTNVILDLLGERKPFYDSAAKIATLADLGKIEISVSALSYATIFYLLSKFEPVEVVKSKLRMFKTIASTSNLTDDVINRALAADFKDFEDAMQYYSAVSMNCQVIITRNAKDFKTSRLPVLSPDEYLTSFTH